MAKLSLLEQYRRALVDFVAMLPEGLTGGQDEPRDDEPHLRIA